MIAAIPVEGYFQTLNVPATKSFTPQLLSSLKKDKIKESCSCFRDGHRSCLSYSMQLIKKSLCFRISASLSCYILGLNKKHLLRTHHNIVSGKLFTGKSSIELIIYVECHTAINLSLIHI